jgi:hypothetical protein
MSASACASKPLDKGGVVKVVVLDNSIAITSCQKARKHKARDANSGRASTARYYCHWLLSGSRRCYGMSRWGGAGRDGGNSKEVKKSKKRLIIVMICRSAYCSACCSQGPRVALRASGNNRSRSQVATKTVRRLGIKSRKGSTEQLPNGVYQDSRAHSPQCRGHPRCARAFD